MASGKASNGNSMSYIQRLYSTPAPITEGWRPSAKDSTAWEFYTREVLLGVTIACAQVPESVAFAFMAHVKPPIALHAAWIVGFICSIFSGRPGMVNGATGAFAAIIGNFVVNEGAGNNGEGIETLFPSVILAGVIMCFVSYFNLSRFILLLPTPVMIGFCNGLAIVIGLAQLHPFFEADETDEHGRRLFGKAKTGAELWFMLLICFSSMAIMEFVPKIPIQLVKVIPSSLLAILVSVLIERAIVRPLGYRTDSIADVFEFTSDSAFPIPFFVDHPTTEDYDLSKITTGSGIVTIIQQGVLLALVGCIEDLLTSEVVESFVKTPSDGNLTVLSMGAANIVSGLMGTMGGNAMIGLSTVNTLNGGRGRLGPTVTAAAIMICCMGAYEALNFIPIAALSGIMIVVVLHTFKWFSLKMLLACFLPQTMRRRLGLHRKIPRVEVAAILAVTVLSNWPAGTNIAYAVLVGTAICAVAFSWEMGLQLQLHSCEEGSKKYYDIEGPLYFASSNRLVKLLDPENDGDFETVEVRLGAATIMDYTAISVIAQITKNYKLKGKSITFQTVNESSVKLIEKANKFAKDIDYNKDGATSVLELSDVQIQDVAAGFQADPMAEAGGAIDAIVRQISEGGTPGRRRSKRGSEIVQEHSEPSAAAAAPSSASVTAPAAALAAAPIGAIEPAASWKTVEEAAPLQAPAPRARRTECTPWSMCAPAAAGARK